MDHDDPLAGAADATLVVRAADGDVRAFEVLARRHGPVARLYAEQVLGSNLESDDVVQDAFLTGWRRLSDLNDPGRFRSWMMQIVTRKALDRLRRRRHHDDVDAVDQPSSSARQPERIVEARMQLDAMWVALDGLPADQRRCWLLRETAGYSYQQIAEELELPVSTVRGLLARARRTLTAEMEAWR
ncbi:RNA polymerase sigma factor [Curtobacterium sp. 9128]|uniref:RNA polymerase sigma factor n=1 Tax=Curtobacterium sp. 9128 TaxID=1793722 RepID=UPI0011A1DD17|nr:sigma-70 family RNA polymerase sigma factor [Curtobacterium sp. 9128]